MSAAADAVSTGQITFAARDSDFDGFKIKSGDILAMENGKLTLPTLILSVPQLSLPVI